MTEEKTEKQRKRIYTDDNDDFYKDDNDDFYKEHSISLMHGYARSCRGRHIIWTIISSPPALALYGAGPTNH